MHSFTVDDSLGCLVKLEDATQKVCLCRNFFEANCYYVTPTGITKCFMKLLNFRAGIY